MLGQPGRTWKALRWCAVRRVSNPPNPWLTTHVEWIGEPPPVAVRVYEERSRSILSENDSPDVPFRWSVNPYRGCQHACAYCYARPTHQYLGLGAGTDFDSKLVVKTNAAELLREAFARRSWRGERVAFSGVTDCYQPIEASYELTRRCLEVCAEFRNPVDVVTKGALVRRDVELLRRTGARVYLSIPFLDPSIARALEPWAPAPDTRFETLRQLTRAGVPTGVAIAPLIPALNDAHVPTLLERAREAGATSVFTILLRLPAEVRGIFEQRLRESFPERADKVLNALREMRAGKLSDSAFGSRMQGSGPRWDTLRQLLELQCRRLGFDEPGREPSEPLASRPRQGTLFEE